MVVEGLKYIELTEEQYDAWKPTSINSAMLGDVKYHWRSPSVKGGDAGWIGSDGTFIKN